MKQGQRGEAMGRNQRRQSPGWVGRPWEQRSGSLREPVISKTVQGFIALRPIPGSRGAASCRPPRSWRLGRRSGRVPAWPAPPPRFLEPTPNHGHPAIPSGIAPAQTGAEECPGNCKAREGSSTRTLTARGMVGEARCERMCSIVMLTTNYIYIYRRIVRDRIAVI
jgi:hypothetical protein